MSAFGQGVAYALRWAATWRSQASPPRRPQGEDRPGQSRGHAVRCPLSISLETQKSMNGIGWSASARNAHPGTTEAPAPPRPGRHQAPPSSTYHAISSSRTFGVSRSARGSANSTAAPRRAAPSSAMLRHHRHDLLLAASSAESHATPPPATILRPRAQRDRAREPARDRKETQETRPAHPATPRKHRDLQRETEEPR
jgi:hypothetical protein